MWYHFLALFGMNSNEKDYKPLKLTSELKLTCLKSNNSLRKRYLQVLAADVVVVQVYQDAHCVAYWWEGDECHKFTFFLEELKLDGDRNLWKQCSEPFFLTIGSKVGNVQDAARRWNILEVFAASYFVAVLLTDRVVLTQALEFPWFTRARQQYIWSARVIDIEVGSKERNPMQISFGKLCLLRRVKLNKGVWPVFEQYFDAEDVAVHAKQLKQHVRSSVLR